MPELKHLVEAAVMGRQGKKQGAEIRFLCPVHDDHHPSARYNPDKGVWTCDVCQSGGTAKELAELLGIETKKTAAQKEIVVVYDYGAFQVVRTKPKGFYQRRPDGAGGWIHNLRGIQTCLYHQDELAAAIEAGRPVFVCEGEKDVDRLRSAGQTATCNPMGAGKWRDAYSDSLDGADLIIVPDNDEPGRAHADAVCRSCYGKAARIRIITLPAGKDTSDFLDGGGTVDQLLELAAASTEYRAEKTPEQLRFEKQYDVYDGRICWLKSTSDGVTEVPLCNFTARVTEDIIRDNGLEQERYFKVRGELPGKRPLPDIEVTAANFNGLNWVTSEWGMQAVIAAGNSSKDRLREAIQLQSSNARARTIYTHTGWREIGGEMFFLHGAGVVGKDDIEVELDPSLQRYQLLPVDGDAVEAINKSLDFYLVAPPETTMPLWAGMYLAPLTELIDTSFTLWLVGASGAFKSTLTSLALCHFGTFDSRHLPAAWRDTQNTLERLMFTAKDLPLVIDDWAPGQDSSKARELEVKAEYVVRAQGNRQGRQRMRADTSIRAGYQPRGLLVTSGEQLPSGHSHTARIFSVEVEREDVDLVYLSAAQEHQLLYCRAMSYYIDWLKRHFKELRADLPRRWRDYRDKAREGQSHPRMPEVIAGLTCAVDLAMEFAQEYGAQTESAAKAFREQAWDIFTSLAAAQSGRIEEERPARRFMSLLQTLIDSGSVQLTNKESTVHTVSPGVKHIGWFYNSNGASADYLNPGAAYEAVVQLAQRQGYPFTVKESALWKDMNRMGFTVCPEGRNSGTLWVMGSTKRVIQLKKKLTPPSESGVSGESGEERLF